MTESGMMKRILPLVALLMMSAAPGGLRDDELIRKARELEEIRVRLVERLSPCVVAMFRSEGQGGGSGVIFDPAGYVLTNYHVVGNAKEMRAGLPGGRILRGQVIGLDPYSDLALVRLQGVGPFPYAPIGDSNALSIGDWTLAMGNPFLLATDFRPTVTLGIVSGLHRFQPGGKQLVYHDSVQVDTPINPGNSGGPLFNMKGEIVGINGRISGRDRGRVNVGVGFAVSANQIREVISDLRAGKLVQHGTLEATVQDRPDAGSDRGFRVVINQMFADSVAANAGLELADEIVEFDGTPIRSQNHYKTLIGILPAGRTVEIAYRRRDGD
ncbi:MAG: trypsin-like peptidase domain-containing protein, partial [Planctomycetota bacterium]|nr:trypsin-like peptidase domain-containing protein [Planctomycetota bacterium]